MLPQNLIQNPIIIDNGTLRSDTAAPLINLNFWFAERGVEETINFRYNQYPYTQHELTEINGNNGSEVLSKMAALPLHSFILLTDISSTLAGILHQLLHTDIFPSAYLIRSHDSGNLTETLVLKDFLVLPFNAARWIYSPSNWYIEYNSFIPNFIRSPLYGLQAEKQYFSNSSYITIQEESIFLTIPAAALSKDMPQYLVQSSATKTLISTPLYFAIDNFGSRVATNSNTITDQLDVYVLLGDSDNEATWEYLPVLAKLERRFVTGGTAELSYYKYDIIIPNRGYGNLFRGIALR